MSALFTHQPRLLRSDFQPRPLCARAPPHPNFLFFPPPHLPTHSPHHLLTSYILQPSQLITSPRLTLPTFPISHVLTFPPSHLIFPTPHLFTPLALHLGLQSSPQLPFLLMTPLPHLSTAPPPPLTLPHPPLLTSPPPHISLPHPILLTIPTSLDGDIIMCAPT